MTDLWRGVTYETPDTARVVIAANSYALVSARARELAGVLGEDVVVERVEEL